MKIDNKISDEFMENIVNDINNSDDKAKAISEAMEKVAFEANKGLVDQIVAQAAADNEKRLSEKERGFRPLTQNEKNFYDRIMKGPVAFQSVTADQIDIIPTEIIDRTIADIKAESGIYDLITFAPIGVQKWLAGSATGSATWGNLTDAITSELNATISALNLDAKKLSGYIVIPKAIRELEMGYVDRYVTAKIEEIMRDGVTAGYLNGDGKTGPIGVMNKIDSFKSDGTASAKSALTTVTGFGPKSLAPVLKTLSHNGNRKIDNLYLVVNPLDDAEYVKPALYGDTFGGGYAQKTAQNITVIEDANMTQGKGVFTIAGHYTMGFSGVQVAEYKETKALDDADVIIAKAYGNGRADDDDVAVVFDVTKLKEYVPAVVTSTATA